MGIVEALVRRIWTEVQQQTDFHTTCPQLVQYLGIVFGMQRQYCFALDCNLAFDNMIRAEESNLFAFVEHRYRNLDLKIDSALSELDRKRAFVHRLEESEVHSIVEGIECGKSFLGDLLMHQIAIGLHVLSDDATLNDEVGRSRLHTVRAFPSPKHSRRAHSIAL